MDTKTATAAQVSAAVTSAGITRRDLSNASGIAYTTLFRKLQGHVAFNVEEIDAIARVLDVTPDALIDWGQAA